MIDDTNYADCLALYNFNHVDKIKGKESFSYIFNDNINYIRSLYNRGKIRNVTYDTIQKTILCGSIYLGYDLFFCPHCGNESIFLDASKFLTDKKTHLHGKCVSSFMERVMGIVPNTEFTVSFSKYPSIKAKKQ